MPGAAWLDGTAHPHHVQVLTPVGGLVGPGLLHLGQTEGEGDGVGQEGHEGTLLQLVAEDGGVRKSSRADCQPCCSIAYGNRETHLG